MPRTANVDPIRSVIQSLGQQIGQELAAAITQSFTDALEGRAGAATRGLGATAAKATVSARATGGTPCSVAGCPRKVAAKGLCQNHYAKAKRLKFDLDALSAGNLETLGQDGRALRFKRDASALVRRKGKASKSK
jgi:hypothetical protein